MSYQEMMIEYARRRMDDSKRGDVAAMVQADVEARAVMGKRKYGTRLRPYNGRSALWDAYQEALDLCMYLRQAIEEWAEKGNADESQPEPKEAPHEDPR